MKDKQQHGGPREGAGAKPTYKGGRAIGKNVYLPQGIWDALMAEAEERDMTVSRVLGEKLGAKRSK